MDEKALLTWFEEIEKRFNLAKATKTSEDDVWARLFTEMITALESVFPPSHPVLRSWEEARQRGRQSQGLTGVSHLPERIVKYQLFGVFLSAFDRLKDGLWLMASGLKLSLNA